MFGGELPIPIFKVQFVTYFVDLCLPALFNCLNTFSPVGIPCLPHIFLPVSVSVLQQRNIWVYVYNPPSSLSGACVHCLALPCQSVSLLAFITCS